VPRNSRKHLRPNLFTVMKWARRSFRLKWEFLLIERIDFALFDTLCQDPESYSLSFGNGIVLRSSVGHCARNIGDFRDPAAIIFGVSFYVQGFHSYS
jgi:hypothetical protein